MLWSLRHYDRDSLEFDDDVADLQNLVKESHWRQQQNYSMLAGAVDNFVVAACLMPMAEMLIDLGHTATTR